LSEKNTTIVFALFASAIRLSNAVTEAREDSRQVKVRALFSTAIIPLLQTGSMFCIVDSFKRNKRASTVGDKVPRSRHSWVSSGLRSRDSVLNKSVTKHRKPSRARARLGMGNRERVVGDICATYARQSYNRCGLHAASRHLLKQGEGGTQRVPPGGCPICEETETANDVGKKPNARGRRK